MASPKLQAFLLVDAVTGEPIEGITPTFDTYVDDAGDAISPQPAISEIGGGLYKFTPTLVADQGIAYVIDATAAALPRYLSGYIRPEDFPEAALAALQATVAAIQAQTDLLSESEEDGGISAARLRLSGADSVTIRDQLDANLTSAWLRAQRMMPLVVGDDWEPRFLVLSSGVPVDLDDYDIEAVLQSARNGAAILTRSSGENVPGSDQARLQIEIDDQTTSNGPTGTSGRGWFTVRFGHEDDEGQDATVLAAAISAGNSEVVNLQIRLTPPGEGPRTWLRGVVEILKSYF